MVDVMHHVMARGQYVMVQNGACDGGGDASCDGGGNAYGGGDACNGGGDASCDGGGDACDGER